MFSVERIIINDESFGVRYMQAILKSLGRSWSTTPKLNVPNRLKKSVNYRCRRQQA